MELQGALLGSYDAVEVQRAAGVPSDSCHSHHRDVVKDSFDLLALVLHRVIDDSPDGIGTGHMELPVLPDHSELAQVHKDAVVDGLPACVGIDKITAEIIEVGHV